MERARLDQILLRKGLVTEDQIRQALLRQKSHQGPLGSHLMYYKYITEEELVSALAEQFGVPGVTLGNRQIPPEVIQKIPVEIAEAHLVFPLAFDPKTRTLSLAVHDPANAQAIFLAKEAAAAWDVEPHVAAESALRTAIRIHYHGKEKEASVEQIIELPDLFGGEEPDGKPERPAEQPDLPEETPPRRVLMITQSPFLRSLLVSIFEREGCSLTVLGEKEEFLPCLREGGYDHVLVSEGLEAAFREAIRGEKLLLPGWELSVFSSVSGALMENHAPYPRMARSLISALMRMAESRSSTGPYKPPYGSICNDAAELSRLLGLNRLAADGVQIAALLLCPAGHAGNDPGQGLSRMGPDFFQGFEQSLETAKDLCFPWDVPSCLSYLSQILAEGISPERADPGLQDFFLGAQVLALVWYRHGGLGRIEGSPEEVSSRIRDGLRAQEGRLYSSECVSAYVRLVQRRQGRAPLATRKDVFIVSEPSDPVRQLVAHLRQEGLSVVEIREISEAVHLFERREPDAIVIHYDLYLDQVTRFCRYVRQGSRTLLYAFTGQNKPSLILNLLDAGFEDVFTPPFNPELITARIGKSLAARAQRGKESEERGGGFFRGTFQALPFVDLVQALAMSQRSCVIRLEGTSGEMARIFLRDGRMVFAKCGEAAGAEAVYRVIRWRDQGSFQIGPATEYPPDNLSVPNDFVLMEGCRLLDEGQGTALSV